MPDEGNLGGGEMPIACKRCTRVRRRPRSAPPPSSRIQAQGRTPAPPCCLSWQQNPPKGTAPDKHPAAGMLLAQSGVAVGFHSPPGTCGAAAEQPKGAGE